MIIKHSHILVFIVYLYCLFVDKSIVTRYVFLERMEINVGKKFLYVFFFG